MTRDEREGMRAALAQDAQRRLEARKAQAERPYLVCCCGEPARTVDEVLFCRHDKAEG